MKKHARGENHTTNLPPPPLHHVFHHPLSLQSVDVDVDVASTPLPRPISSLNVFHHPLSLQSVDVDVGVASTPLPRPISSLIKKGSKIESEIIWIMDCI